MKEISCERFGYHVVYDVDICDAIDFASVHGFGYIVPDLMVPRFFPERFTSSERRHIREVASSKGVSVSFHGPSDYLCVGTLYPEVRQAVLHRMRMCIDFAADVEAERFTIHVDPPFDFVFAGREGTFLRDHWTVYKDAMRRSLIELAEYARGKTFLCVENDRISRMSMEILEELLAKDRLFLAWDLPKGYTIGGERVVEIESFFTRHLNKVRECHINDQKPGQSSHDMIGVGKIDFPHYLRMLLDQDVHFTIEIRPREKALQGLEVLKTMVKNIGWRFSACC